jgi:hypothetical protein
VSPSGGVTAAGRLADGTPLSAGACLNADGTVPYYAGIDKSARGAGSVLGVLSLQPDASVECTGTYAWFRPASTGAYYPSGFAVSGTVTGALLPGGAEAASLESSQAVTVEAEISAGGLAAAIDETGELQGSGKIAWTAPGTENLTLTVGTSGQVTGSFIDPVTAKKCAVLGMWLGNRQIGGGFFLGDNGQAGALTLGQ